MQRGRRMTPCAKSLALAALERADALEKPLEGGEVDLHACLPRHRSQVSRCHRWWEVRGVGRVDACACSSSASCFMRATFSPI